MRVDQQCAGRCHQLLHHACRGIRIHRIQEFVKADEIGFSLGRPPKEYVSRRIIQSLGPALDLGMLHDITGFGVGQRLKGELMPLLFERDPGRERLFDDPSARALQTLGKLVDLDGQVTREMGRDDAGGHD